MPALRPLVVLVALSAGGCAFGEGLAFDAGSDNGDPVDAAVADAPVDAAVDAGCTEQWINLLINGDFEAGNSTWAETTNDTRPIIREVPDLPFDPAAGTWAAVVLGFSDAIFELAQTAAVPADATALRMTGFRCWVTEESAGAVDLASIELRDDTGAALESLLAISNEDAGATCAWESFELPVAEAHAGANLTLALAGQSDAATVTSFAFDTLALEARVCRF